ncbi:KinB-signaling pathway activation protein [Bacillus sp. RG28]|uniref:KinB-signaling pathway activation protein n=1 Tax=Gottfriedia endophytica TaxID=2820819 RepID=A0A940NMC5_9BACI|nr:KinB-signaling pathway activation protein [Gottfriedia endophytica]MBP0727105.1 KinB-signaling pathway activation protein [Gottfriedia endophytica]
MTSRKWVQFFMKTLVIGAIITLIIGLAFDVNEYALFIKRGEYIKVALGLFGLLLKGLLYSVYSQMGFFAYLTIHRFGLNFFKSIRLWNIVQSVFIIFALGDLIYLRYIDVAHGKGSILSYLIPSFALLVVGVVVASYKAKATNKDAFVPALFFMTVITIVEWIPALRINQQLEMFYMVTTLLVCNSYQLLTLHKTLKS